MKLLLEVIALALTTVRENKVRSFLTVLGVIIGTGTIIGVGSILAGFDASVTGAIRSMGTNTILVFKNTPFGGGRTPEERQRKPLTYENMRSIIERSPSIARVVPVIQEFRGIVRARFKGNDVFRLQLFGVSEDYSVSGQADMRTGRFFTDTEDRHRMPVTVLGEDVYKGLFGSEDALGKVILVAGHQLEVVGVMNRSSVGLPGQSDNRVVIPYFTYRGEHLQADRSGLRGLLLESDRVEVHRQGVWVTA